MDDQFKKDFSLTESHKSLEAYYSLLYRLTPEIHKKWTIKSLDQYIEKFYRILKDNPPQQGNKEMLKSEYVHIDKDLYESCDKETTYVGFNTGLADKSYKTIYCFGEVVDKDKDQYVFIGFFSETDFPEKKINPNFVKGIKNIDILFKNGINSALKDMKDIKLPPEPSWDDANDDWKKCCEKRKRLLDGTTTPKIRWDVCGKDKREKQENIEKYIRDHGKGEKLSGWAHFIIDGADNLPTPILQWLLNVSNPAYVKWKYDIQYNMLQDQNCNEICKSVYNIIIRAVEYSKDMCRYRNLVAPYYYIESRFVNKIQFMLPLFLEYDDEPDCAVLFDSDGNIHTLLNMDEVHTDLRILGKLDAYRWLSSVVGSSKL